MTFFEDQPWTLFVVIAIVVIVYDAVKTAVGAVYHQLRKEDARRRTG